MLLFSKCCQSRKDGRKHHYWISLTMRGVEYWIAMTVRGAEGGNLIQIDKCANSMWICAVLSGRCSFSKCFQFSLISICFGRFSLRQQMIRSWIRMRRNCRLWKVNTDLFQTGIGFISHWKEVALGMCVSEGIWVMGLLIGFKWIHVFASVFVFISVFVFVLARVWGNMSYGLCW